jgi:DNA-binding beta-propeller fold protein YncE
MNNKGLKLYVLLFALFLSIPTISFSQSGYKVTGSIELGGESRWDYLYADSEMHRLYVSNSTKVHVVDLTNNKVIGTITNLHGVHGIAICPVSGKGFISNGQTNSITIFDVKTLKVTGSIEVLGKKPDAIVYDPFTKRVFSFNGGSANATAIDGITGKIVGTVKLDGNPEFAVSDEKGKMFVNLEKENAIEGFDPVTLNITNKWLIAPVEGPSGLAIDLKHNILFSTGDNKLMAIVDASTGKLISSPPIGGRVDGGTFDQTRQLAFSSNGEGTMTIIKEAAPDNFSVVENVPTLKGARTITIDQSTHKIYSSAMITKGTETTFGVLIIEKQ